ncbi:unnamed protein product, partial [Thlaspi arvense]
MYHRNLAQVSKLAFSSSEFSALDALKPPPNALYFLYSIIFPPLSFRYSFSAMAESKTKLAEIREWIIDHKLRTVGNSSPFVPLFILDQMGRFGFIREYTNREFRETIRVGPSLHAQALTLAALAGAAAVEYYDHKTGATDRYPKFLKPENLNKD